MVLVSVKPAARESDKKMAGQPIPRPEPISEAGGIMVLVSYSGREINAKLVYYGPGLSGKTTNLEYIYGAIPQTHRGKMVSMKTKTERTLFFDFLPIQLGELSGFKTRFLLYTVPGQVYYNATRKLVLKGVDAVVFVADSKRGKMDENIESLENLRENLKEHGLELEKIPWVIQYNKRDLPDVYTIEELDRALNPQKVPSFEAVAKGGQGVIETFKTVSRMLLKHLSQEIGVRVVAEPEAQQADIGPRTLPEASAPAIARPVAPLRPIASGPQSATPAAAPPPASLSPLPSLSTRSPQQAPAQASPPSVPAPRPVRPPPPMPQAPHRPREWAIPVAPGDSQARAPRMGEPEPSTGEPAPAAKDLDAAFPPRELRLGPPVTACEGGQAIGSCEDGDEGFKPEGMGTRLRRWLARTRDPEPALFPLEIHPSSGAAVDAEPMLEQRPASDAAPPVSNAATEPPTESIPVVPEIGTGPQLVIATSDKGERYREVPILVDLDPEDLEHGVVLKLRICVRRASDGSLEDRAAASWRARAA